MNGFAYNGNFVAGYSAQGYYSAPAVYPAVVNSWPVPFQAAPTFQVARKSPQPVLAARPGYRPPPPLPKTEVDLTLLRIELGAFYNAHNPAQVPKIPSIIQDFAERGGTKEELVFLNMDLRDRYGADLESIRSAESKRSRESRVHTESPYDATIQSSAPVDAMVQSSARVSLGSAEYFLPRNRLFDDSTADTPHSQGASTRASLPYSSQGSITSAASSGCLQPSPTISNGLSPSIPASNSPPEPYALHQDGLFREQSLQPQPPAGNPHPHVNRVCSPEPEPVPPQDQPIREQKTGQRRKLSIIDRSDSGVVAVEGDDEGDDGPAVSMVPWRAEREEFPPQAQPVIGQKMVQRRKSSLLDRSGQKMIQRRKSSLFDRSDVGVVAVQGDEASLLARRAQREEEEQWELLRAQQLSHNTDHPLEASPTGVWDRSESAVVWTEKAPETVSPSPQTPSIPNHSPPSQTAHTQTQEVDSAWMASPPALSVEQLKAASLSPQPAGLHASHATAPMRVAGTHNLLEVLLLPSPSLSTSTQQAALQARLALDGQQVQRIACGGAGLDARAGVGTVSFEVSDSVNLLSVEIWEGAGKDGARERGEGVCWGRAEVALPELLQGGRHTIVTSQAHQTLITTNQVQLHLDPIPAAEGGRRSAEHSGDDVAVHLRVKYGSGHPIPRNDFRRVLSMFEGTASATGEDGEGGAVAETEQMEASFGMSTGSYHMGAVEGLQSADRILQAISLHLQPSNDSDEARKDDQAGTDLTAARIEELRLQLQEQRRVFVEQAREKEENQEAAWKALLKAQRAIGAMPGTGTDTTVNTACRVTQLCAESQL